MKKPADVELAQLKTAVDYLASVFEEGSLAAQFEPAMRQEVAEILRLLLKKVAGLPADIPEHLVQAAAVRAIVSAADEGAEAHYHEDSEKLRHKMRQAEIAATLQGHTLGPWEPRADSDVEQAFFAVCQACRGMVIVSLHATTALLIDHIPAPNGKQRSGSAINQETILALWDLAQTESD